MVTIPKAVNKEHITDNLHALNWNLEKNDLEQIEVIFPSGGQARFQCGYSKISTLFGA
jgi:diketogulonate reductase-like aldo/keto reductase